MTREDKIFWLQIALDPITRNLLLFALALWFVNGLTNRLSFCILEWVDRRMRRWQPAGEDGNSVSLLDNFF